MNRLDKGATAARTHSESGVLRKAFVAANASAIGYVSAGARISGQVRVVQIRRGT